MKYPAVKLAAKIQDRRNQQLQVKKLGVADIHENMLDYFNRYQEVTRVGRVEKNEKVIKDNHFVENWGKLEKQENIKTFRKLLK